MLQGGKIIAQGTFDDLSRNQDPRVQHFLNAEYDHDDDSIAPRHNRGTPPISEIIR
jgi:ABC-type transporter Mla maintaining outer membrane lipid asymmetry ATPase subunit MlaF